MKMTFRFTVFGGMVVFTVMAFMVVFMPDMMWAPKRSINAHPYEGLAAKGRKVFYSNGCNYCHTQYVREVDTGMGKVSDGGDFVFDSPLVLGSERTGPDLTHLGRKRSIAWEMAHLRDPRKYSPLSIMPSFSFLPDEDVEAVSTYLFGLGERTAAAYMVLPPDPYEGKTDAAPPPALEPSAGDSPQGWALWRAAGLQEGKELYIARCQTCHGCAGNGLGTYGGTLIVTPADFRQEPFRNMPEEQWFWHVSEGVQGTVMPPWRESMTPAQRWSAIRYIRDTFSRPVMRDPDEGDPPAEYAGRKNPLPMTLAVLEQGKRIFTRECLVCHGAAGRGDGPYGHLIQPSPPDFGDGSYGTIAKPKYGGVGYFWRISEGLPWSAMPVWKLEYSEADRWALVHYVQAMFTHTEAMPPKPPKEAEFHFPAVYRSQAYPAGVSYERGKNAYASNCANCHGLAGDGKGWDAGKLDPAPGDFRKMAKMPMSPQAAGEHLAKVSFGIMDTAMPAWGEFLPLGVRWDLVKYILDTHMMGVKPQAPGAKGFKVAANYMGLNPQNWKDEGHVVSVPHGKEVFATYCATCHGAAGKGNGPGVGAGKSPGPGALRTGVSQAYLFWMVMEGAPGSTMPSFKALLTDRDVWDLTTYALTLTASHKKGGS